MGLDSRSSFDSASSVSLSLESYALVEELNTWKAAWGKRPALWVWTLQAVIFLSSCVVLWLAWSVGRSNTRCVNRLSMFSPALHLFNDDYEERRFVGTFQAASPWKGPPNPKVDSNWAIIAESWCLHVNRLWS